jgi:hypothetical protein
MVSFTPRSIYPRGKSSGTHLIGGWVGLRVCLNNVEKRKILPYRDSNSDSSVVQLVASLYTY